MTPSRLLSLVALVCLLGALGCGKTKPTDAGAPAVAPVVVVNPPGPALPDGTPSTHLSDAVYELDPAKHVFPAAPASGRLAGRPFTPDRIELEGNKLTFRQGKDFFPDLSIDVFLDDKAPPAGTLKRKLVVHPTQKWTDGVPSLHVSARKGKDDLPDTQFVNDGYALTLELDKALKGSGRGRVYLCLPGPEKSYLVGTFAYERKRALSAPPGDEEVPFIAGTVTPALKKGQSVSVGYVGLPVEGKVISDGSGGQAFGDDGSGGASRSTTFAPRAASLRIEKFVPRFDFTNLPPGRYLVYARVKDGPAAWAWATVAAGARVAADLALDASKAGMVAVKLPAGEREASLVPADLGSPPPDERFLERLSFSLDLRAEAKDGTATIANVPAGKYQVRAGALRADVEVTAGKTATVELKPAADEFTAEKAKALIPDAAGMPADDVAKFSLGTEFTPEMFAASRGQTLVWWVLMHAPYDLRKNSTSFKFLDYDTQVNPAMIAELMVYPKDKEGKHRKIATVIRFEDITNCTCKVDGNTASGVVSFKTEKQYGKSTVKLYEGNIEYTARKKGDEWRIEEFRLPDYKVTLALGADGKWVKK